ncbi:MAG: hypothetical protein QM705_05225 [Ancrocorticia sp.]
MNRRIVALTIATASLLGLSACGGSGSSTESSAPVAEQTVAAAPEASAPTEDESKEDESKEDATRSADMSLVDECLSLTEPLGKANAAMLKIADDTSNDPQDAVDTWRALAVAFEDFGKVAANTKVAELSAAVGTDGHALADEMQKVYVDEDIASLGAFTQANDKFFASYGELLELCNTAK